MAFVPKINFCLEKDNDDNYVLQVTDITDVYDDPDNLTGWEDASTLEAADVTSLEIVVTITDSANAVTTITVDTTDILADPVTGTFDLNPIAASEIGLIDGFYKVEYIVSVGATEYKACKQKFIYTNVACCISKAIKKLLNDPTDNIQQEFVDKLKALEFALLESAKTLDYVSGLKVLALLQDYCNSPQANCGCGC